MPSSVTAVLVTGGKPCDVAVVVGLHLLVEDLRLDMKSLRLDIESLGHRVAGFLQLGLHVPLRLRSKLLIPLCAPTCSPGRKGGTFSKAQHRS